MSKSGSRPKGGRKGGPKGGQYRAKKRLGQNFLADGSVVSAIVDALGAGPSDTVIEIGPGAGNCRPVKMPSLISRRISASVTVCSGRTGIRRMYHDRP